MKVDLAKIKEIIILNNGIKIEHFELKSATLSKIGKELILKLEK